MSEIAQDRPAHSTPQLSPEVAGPRSSVMAVAEGWRLLRHAVLSLRVEGLRPTIRYAWARVSSTEDRYLFVQHLKPPPTPVTLPVEVNGIVVRQMTARDRDDLRVRRHEPREADRLLLGVVGERDGRIVGAAWYTDYVNPAQLWYRAVEPHLIQPVWYDTNIFAVPGEKGVAWTIFKTATDVLATKGIRSTVALVTTTNKPSIFLLRLLGAKIVARMTVRRWLGYRTAVVEPVAEDRDAAIAAPAKVETRPCTWSKPDAGQRSS